MTGGKLLSLDSLFAAQAVAVIGASADPSKIGGRPLKFLKENGYRGAVYPINPRSDLIQGLPSFPSIDAVPHDVDHVVLAVPSSGVLDAAAACAAKGVRSLTIFGSGFAEIGAEGAAQQDKLTGIAADNDMRILGPNCMGFMDLRRGLIASFAFMVDLGLPPVGRVALVSQSGAFGGQALVMARDRKLPLGAWVTTGNECDIEIADCIGHFARDDGTDVILGYLEGCKSADKLIAALALAQENGKAVIVLKAGRSEIGRQAVQSHTGALAGNDKVFDAIFRQFGVHRASSIESLFDVAYAASAGQFPKAGKVGVFTVSGGVGVLTADAAEKVGLTLPAMPEAAQAKLHQLLPHAAVRNPVDGTAQIWSDMRIFETFLATMSREGDFEAILIFLTAMPYSAALQKPLKEVLLRFRRENPAKLLILSMLAPPELCEEIAQAGYLLFEDTGRAINAIAALREIARGRANVRAGGVLSAPMTFGLGEATDERALKSILSSAGIAVPPERLARDISDGKAAADAAGYPVALKIVSPDILHKTDIGGVALGLKNGDELAAAWTKMMSSVRNARPEAKIEGALVTPMISGGTEMIVGIHRDPVFGLVAMVGFGGVFADIIDDTAVHLAPVTHGDAEEMIRGLRAFDLLDGQRGMPKADIAALADAVVRLSQIAIANEATVDSLEINPLLVKAEGCGAVALDAAMVVRPVNRQE